MNNINYDKELSKLIDKNIKDGVKPTLLMHSCCAPCSTTCLQRLKDAFEVTVFYYNPNIDGVDEYQKRQDEQVKLCDKWGIKVITNDFDSSSFYSAVAGYEKEKEGDKRCFICYRLRLEKTAEYALKNGFKYFATTLTVSPLKNANKLNEIGFQLEKEYGVNYLPTDFKKNNGYLDSIKYSKEYGLYRQSYCGCEFSKNK